MLSEYLKNHQKIAYRSFLSAFQSNHLSHAYLLEGEAGIPLKESALFLAKSVLCDNPNPLADEECRTCQRVDHGNYADLLVLDGSASSIKKGDVEAIVDNFQRSAMEKKGIMIYVIHLVENMTVEAVNSLLKFLEEPPKGTFAFLTTQNVSKVLPTIVSRCVLLRMVLQPREETIKEAVAEGVNLEDAELISNFTNGAELIKEKAESDSYQNAKECFQLSLDALKEGRRKAIFLFELNIIPRFGGKGASKEDARMFLDMLSLAYKDLISLENNQPIALTQYATLLSELAERLPHKDKSLLEIMKVRTRLDLNASPAILLDHLINYLTEDTR